MVPSRSVVNCHVFRDFGMLRFFRSRDTSKRARTTTMSVTFHALPPSDNSACTRCVLKCAGIEHEEVNAYGQTRTPEYLAKFPTNLAPAIEHDGAYVSETNAIARYLCTAFPEKAGKFYPVDAKTQAKVDMIAEYTGISLYNLIATAMYPDVGFGGAAGSVHGMDSLKASVPESQAAAAAELLTILNDKYVNGWLKDTTYLGGDEPTIADFRFGPILLFARVAVKLPARIEKYINDLEENNPGYKEATEGPKGFTADKIKA